MWRGPYVLVVQKPLHQALENTQNQTCPRRTWSLVPKFAENTWPWKKIPFDFNWLETCAQHSQIHLFDVDSNQHLDQLSNSANLTPSCALRRFFKIHEKIHLEITEAA